MTYKHLRIGAILLGASAFLPAGAIIAPIEIETVTVGDAGNVPDTRYNSINVGSVGYKYQIGKYEVTTAQYVEFLRAVASAGDIHELYNDKMADISSTYYGCGIERSGDGESGYTYTIVDGYANKPVNYVSFWDAARFCNWLTNGTDTENGMYIFSGDGQRIVTNPDHSTVTGWALPSEDEWYKAAYYKGDDTDAGYWDFPTKSDTIVSGDAKYMFSSINGTAVVGYYSTKPSAYGTFDQGGNVREWNDTVVITDGRGVRGGGFPDSAFRLKALERGYLPLAVEDDYTGFRVVRLGEVPEPQTYALFGGIFLSGVIFLRRRNKK